MERPARSGRRSTPREQVVLNIYDLHDNSWLYHLGIGGHEESVARFLRYTHYTSAAVLISCCSAGIFHSGVQVYGVVSLTNRRVFAVAESFHNWDGSHFALVCAGVRVWRSAWPGLLCAVPSLLQQLLQR